MKRALKGIAAASVVLGTMAAPMSAYAATTHYNTTKVAHESATTLKSIMVTKTEKFTVTIKDSHNKPIKGALVTFRSSNRSVATASPGNVVTNSQGQATVTITGHKAGTAYFTVTANGVSHKYKVTVTQPAAPTVSITGLSNNQTVLTASQTVTVKSNEKSVKLYLNGKLQSGNGPTFKLTLRDGKNTITAVVTNGVETKKQSIYVTLGEPSVSITGLSDGQVVTTASQKVTVNSNEKSVKLYLNGKLQSGSGPDFNLTLREGKNTITAVATNGVDTKKQSIYVTYNPQVAVSSVSAINAEQIQVVFNEPVDKKTAEDVTNYTLNGTNLNSNAATGGAPATSDAKASLQADGKTVIITVGSTGGFQADLSTKTGYLFTVDGVKSADGTSTVSKYSTTFSFAGDTTPATVTNVSASAGSASSTTTVVVDFSEPVKGTGLYYINGEAATIASASLAGSAVTVTSGLPASPVDSITLTAPKALAAGSSNSLQIVNEADTSGNYTNVTQSFTVTQDTVAPTVSSVSAVDDHTIRVTFSKKIDPTTLETADAGSALKDVQILKSDGTNVTGATVAPTANDTTGTEYDITYKPASTDWDANGNLALTLVFTNGIKDTSGNALSPSTQSVTLHKNTVVPKVTSIQYAEPGAKVDGTTVGTNGAFVVTFNEPIAVNDVTTGQYTAVDDSGNDVTSTLDKLTAQYDGNGDNNILVLSPSNAVPSTAKSITFYFSAGAFTDDSAAANTSADQTVTVDLTKGATAPDTTAPTVKITGASATPVNGLNHNAITYTVDNDVDPSTVLNLNNYRLNGAALPSGSYVTIASGTPDTVTVHLGTGTIKTSGDYSFTVMNIADKSGNVANTAVKTVSLTSDVAPTLTGASFGNDGQTLILTFSKHVSGANGNDGDFTVKLNGTTLAPSTDFTVADGTGALDGDVIVTFGSGVTIKPGDTVTVSVSGSDVKDGDGNVVAGSNTVSATK
ncbi:Ig-like domain-containing protein [Alicyclobacillus shizuokensis]|uniref:Ig-like domain-containing protein n=1 Tax=Alicyclobacillus shizuokensis TaxID=392014 RepID=UPI00082B5688|nr:Ig-like domain-containing protein [Alicyclobacillus shizuokensis]